MLPQIQQEVQFEEEQQQLQINRGITQPEEVISTSERAVDLTLFMKELKLSINKSSPDPKAAKTSSSVIANPPKGVHKADDEQCHKCRMLIESYKQEISTLSCACDDLFKRFMQGVEERNSLRQQISTLMERNNRLEAENNALNDQRGEGVD